MKKELSYIGALNSLTCKLLEHFTWNQHETGEASSQQMEAIRVEQHWRKEPYHQITKSADSHLQLWKRRLCSVPVVYSYFFHWLLLPLLSHTETVQTWSQLLILQTNCFCHYPVNCPSDFLPISSSREGEGCHYSTLLSNPDTLVIPLTSLCLLQAFLSRHIICTTIDPLTQHTRKRQSLSFVNIPNLGVIRLAQLSSHLCCIQNYTTAQQNSGQHNRNKMLEKNKVSNFTKREENKLHLFLTISCT